MPRQSKQNSKKTPVKSKIKTRYKSSSNTKQPRLKTVTKREASDKRELDLSQVSIKKQPFKSKFKIESIPIKFEEQPPERDQNIKQNMKKFKRPYFSPYVNSYEADLAFIENNKRLKLNPYLFLININTKYLYILLLNNKDENSIQHAFDKLIYYGLRINSLRSDGEASITALDTYFEKLGVKTFHNSSPYVNKNRVVDRVIRTIRDMYYNVVGDKQLTVQNQHNILQQLVTIYNNTIHSTTKKKPAEMTYKDEYDYIEKMKKELKNVLNRQYKAGLLTLKKGKTIKVYLDQSKTNKAFKKKRGNYIHDAKFKEYVNGNAKIILNETGEEIIIPIYWIKPTKVELINQED